MSESSEGFQQTFCQKKKQKKRAGSDTHHPIPSPSPKLKESVSSLPPKFPNKAVVKTVIFQGSMKNANSDRL